MTDTRQSGTFPTVPHSQHAKVYLSAFDGSPDGLTEAEAALRMAGPGDQIDAHTLHTGLKFLGLFGLVDLPCPEAIAARIGLQNPDLVLTGANRDKLYDAQLAL